MRRHMVYGVVWHEMPADHAAHLCYGMCTNIYYVRDLVHQGKDAPARARSRPARLSAV